MTSRTLLDKDMRVMRDAIVQMASRVDTAVDQALHALQTCDTQQANIVIANDKDINRLRHQIEDQALLTLATQQPAARDLRTIITTIHLAVELERMGDHAAGIARLACRLQGEAPLENLHKLPKMAKRARQMTQEAVQAFLEHDADMARTLLKRDAKLDRNYKKLVIETMEAMRDETYIRRATYLIWAGHNLERIGDRATNIAERVIFMITGEFTEVSDMPDQHDHPEDDLPTLPDTPELPTAPVNPDTTSTQGS